MKERSTAGCARVCVTSVTPRLRVGLGEGVMLGVEVTLAELVGHWEGRAGRVGRGVAVASALGASEVVLVGVAAALALKEGVRLGLMLSLRVEERERERVEVVDCVAEAVGVEEGTMMLP